MLHPSASRGGTLAVEQESDPQPEAGLLSFLEVAGRLHGRIAEVLSSIGLSYPGYEVLAFLRSGTGRATLGELDDVLRCPSATASGTVAELAGSGLVGVATDEASGGVASVTLTPQGSARAIEGRMQLDIVLLEFAAHFRASERVALGRLLDKFGR